MLLLVDTYRVYVDFNRCKGFGTNRHQETGVVYDSEKKMCVICQQDIGRNSRLNCVSCLNNGGGNCDPNGCPAAGLTQYNSSTLRCDMEQQHKQCKLNKALLLF